MVANQSSQPPPSLWEIGNRGTYLNFALEATHSTKWTQVHTKNRWSNLQFSWLVVRIPSSYNMPFINFKRNIKDFPHFFSPHFRLWDSWRTCGFVDTCCYLIHKFLKQFSHSQIVHNFSLVRFIKFRRSIVVVLRIPAKSGKLLTEASSSHFYTIIIIIL